MRFSLKTVALGALAAAAVSAAPIEMERRDAATDRIVDLGLIQSIDINQMSMDFTGTEHYAPRTASSDIQAKMLSIPGIDLPITSVRQHVILIDNGIQLGQFDTPWSPASVSNGVLKTSFTSSIMNVFPDAHEAFTKFVGGLSTSPSRSITLKGTVDAKLDLGILGSPTISGIGFKVTTTLAGLNNLQDIKFNVLIDQDFYAQQGFIVMTSIININNPSKLSVSLGDISLDTAGSKGRVGTSEIKSLALVPGPNTLVSTTKLDMSLPASVEFLNDLLGADQILSMSGFDGTSANPVLNTAMRAVASKITVPQTFGSLSRSPYSDFKLKVLPSTATDRKVEITATFYSPYYGVPVELLNASPSDLVNSAQVKGVSGTADTGRLFYFLNNFQFKTAGNSGTTVTFQVELKQQAFAASDRLLWTELVEFAKINGHIPVSLNWLPDMSINNDGKPHRVEWGNEYNRLDAVRVAVDADFAEVLEGIPQA
ncbi:hypothetical protein DFQ27_009272 [Actinomortierella ambigua]|uniref:Uncharacterized protein n=1 Tax=Actinomortierella ambigua TaxID=1343610 RepID=A0A9P6TXE8_9FUNG|nr:hypothetical protein DFQ27_009272 [Actinomortierella ambigua]